jgi:Amt family ammonium transporter
MMFQMTFAIITPALIAGAFADRMKFSAMCCSWCCGRCSSTARSRTGCGRRPAGSATGLPGVLDFAGGTVVHINAGIAGLVCCLVLGKRVGYGTRTWRRTTSPTR